MTHFLKPALAAGIALAAVASPLALAPAFAQAAAPTVRGIAIVNITGVVANSNAYKVAAQQRPVTYKAQIDQATARRNAITQQITPLYAKLQSDSQAAGANQASLQQQAAQLQQLQQAGEQELNQILAPVALSQAYVEEQIQDKLSAAVQAAAKKQSVSLVLTPDQVVYADNAYNLNQAVLTELNALIPAAQLVPPQGWLPREMREQQAAQQQAAGQRPAAAPAAGQRPATAPVQGR
ncbi:MAG: OmpH family outer membrane protein [Croceibacterium sp.]